MTQNFASRLKKYQARINQTLQAAYPDDLSRAAQAARYSLDAGGKRLRPLLAVAFYETLANQPAAPDVYRAALSLEYVHTFSLIHDDLPALDNDDLRRGQPTCHRQFDEATAILAGDYLLNHAYLNLTQTAVPAETQAALVAVLSAATRQILVGEMLDLEGETCTLTEEELSMMYQQKTGALFSASFLFGSTLADSLPGQFTLLSHQLGLTLGMAFQIQDDVLDVIGDEQSLGKKVHKDAAAAKNTWVAHYGLAEAKFAYQECYQKVIAQLQLLPSNPHRAFLLQLIDYLQNRTT